MWSLLELVKKESVMIKTGWWKLHIKGIDHLTDVDKEHISKLILDGFTEGEIIQEDEE